MKNQNNLAGGFVRCEEGTNLRVTGVATDGDRDRNIPPRSRLQSTLLEGGMALTIGVGDVSKRLRAPECVVSGCRCAPITASFAMVLASRGAEVHITGTPGGT